MSSRKTDFAGGHIHTADSLFLFHPGLPLRTKKMKARKTRTMHTQRQTSRYRAIRTATTRKKPLLPRTLHTLYFNTRNIIKTAEASTRDRIRGKIPAPALKCRVKRFGLPERPRLLRPPWSRLATNCREMRTRHRSLSERAIPAMSSGTGSQTRVELDNLVCVLVEWW